MDVIVFLGKTETFQNEKLESLFCDYIKTNELYDLKGSTFQYADITSIKLLYVLKGKRKDKKWLV